MRILVTGSSGILGRRVCQVLSKMKRQIFVVRFEGDITDLENVKMNFRKHDRIDVVIHLAAVVSLKDVEAEPGRAYAVNVGGTINILREMEKLEKKPYFLFSSSAHIYAPSNDAIKEDNVKIPISLYGKTKLIAEQVAEDICKRNRQAFCAARIFSLFDEEQKPPFLYGAIQKRLQNENLNESFFLPQADSLRDFSSAEEIADLIVRLLEKKVTGPVNIGSGKGTKIRDFVQSMSHQKLNIISNDLKTALVADISKMKRVLS